MSTFPPPFPIFLYRFQTSKSATTHDYDMGFICGKWRHKPSFKEPTKSHFRKHMNGVRSPSPHISLTESPARLYNFYRYKEKEQSDAGIALVDVRKLPFCVACKSFHDRPTVFCRPDSTPGNLLQLSLCSPVL